MSPDVPRSCHTCLVLSRPPRRRTVEEDVLVTRWKTSNPRYLLTTARCCLIWSNWVNMSPTPFPLMRENRRRDAPAAGPFGEKACAHKSLSPGLGDLPSTESETLQP